MPGERTIPSNEPKTVATFTILSDGAAISQTHQVLSITVRKEINRIPAALLLIKDGDPAAQSFEASNADTFLPGKEIEIKAGYRADEETIFKGIIIKHAIKVRKNGSVLAIECRDVYSRMTIETKSKYFTDAKDSDVMDELIASYGLEKDIAISQVTQKQLVQYNCTDWDFMLCRIDVNGMHCIVSDGKATIKPPDFAAAPVLIIQYGATVHELDAEIDARLQFKKLKGKTWDFSNLELLNETEASEPALPVGEGMSPDDLANVMNVEAYSMQHAGKIETDEMQQWVNAKLLRHRLARVRGRVKTDGKAAVLPGQMIQIQGVGKQFEGKLYVTGVHHEISEGNWNATFQFGVNPEWFAETYKTGQPLAGAMVPAIQGLHAGIVTKLESDPDGDERIQVKIPLINNEEEGTWCRMASLDAGRNRGMVFRPEIGDEVVVGFFNNDPRHGVILGMLYSSTNTTPITASDNNHQKGYVSRSEMKMIFDDEKKIFELQTPAGNKIQVDEDEQMILLEDQHGNKIKMNEDGISIESIKDVIIKATNDLKADAVNAAVKASAQAKIEGSGAAELKAGGTVKVQGAIVQIN